MKVHKMFCVDLEVAERLKEENASSLVNGILIEYFKNKQPKTLEEKELLLKKLKAEEKYMRELQEIENE